MADETTKPETKSETPAAKAPAKVEKTIVRVVTSLFDDNGKLRAPGEIIAVESKRAEELIAGKEAVDAETELQAKLDADQRAVEAMKKA